MHAHIIGAGIAGPMAAITLASLGHEVDVWEVREEGDLRSDGILGIKPESMAILRRFEVNGAFERSLPVDESWNESFITWTDLHRSLVEAAMRYPVRFHYGERFSQLTGNDRVIYAGGVGSAKEVTKANYTGFVVYRGLSEHKAGTAWVWQQMDGWKVAAGDTREGASITAFIPRQNVALRTTYTDRLPDEFLEFARWHSLRKLSLWNWDRLLTTVPQWLVQPISDWDVPSQMIRGNTVRIGDANGQLRPRTGMGANLAIREASDPNLLLNLSRVAEQQHLADKTHWHYQGINLGV